MAIKVVHTKVSTIPDGDDTSLIRPSDWNADHTLVGLGTMAEQNANNVTITGGSISGVTVSGYISTTQKGVANGVATLDSGGQIPLSQIPPLGDLNYQGSWNASTNTPTLTSSVGTKGYYYVVSVAGTTNLNGITDWQPGDWAVFNGSVWQKIDNTDAVTSVNGQTGAVTITLTGLGAGTIATQNANAVAITGGSIDGTPIGATTASTGAFTTVSASTKVATPYVDATSSAGGALRNSVGTPVIQWGIANTTNSSIDGSININGTNAQIDLSPTGTGHVHINPSGTNSVQINPTYVGTIDNMTIGATTPKAITGTTITATSFVGSGASLTNVVNSLTASTGISVSGSTGAITVTNTAPDQTVAFTNGTGISVTGTYPNFTITNTSPSSGGTVTSVSGTAPVSVATGTTTPVISLASGYGDTQNPYASKTANYVLAAPNGSAGAPTFRALVSADIPSLNYVSSVSATAPLTSTGGLTPTLAMPAATGSVNGYLTSTDWTTFNNKQPAGAYLTAVTADAPLTGSGTSASHLSIPAATGSVNGYLTSTDWTTFNGKAPAVTYTSTYVPYGQGTTTPALSANFTFNGTNLTLGTAGVSARLQGDFSNATVNSRTAFQTGTTNGSTGIYALPNGTSTAASWQATNAADPTNASKVLIATNGSTDVQLVSGINGTGTYLPLTFWNNGAEKMRLSVAGGLAIGSASDAGAGNLLVQNTITATKYVGISGGTF
jgi:hypothetical protein